MAFDAVLRPGFWRLTETQQIDEDDTVAILDRRQTARPVAGGATQPGNEHQGFFTVTADLSVQWGPARAAPPLIKPAHRYLANRSVLSPCR